MNQTRHLSLTRNTILVMRRHPTSEGVVALGCKLGLVLVVNVSGKGKVIHKIRAHNEDIQGIDFSPKNEIHELFNDETDPLLAVSCRNRSVSLWSSNTAKQLALLQLPHVKVENPWITLKWASKSKIIVTCSQGEIGLWDLDKLTPTPNGKSNMIKSADLQYLHYEHPKVAFSLGVFQSLVYSCGYDRSLVCFNFEQNELVFNMPTFASKIVCMATNSVDPSILAIGGGDGNIRVWKTASTKVMFDCNTIWQKLSRCEISALAWHPDRENLLAFGTAEGQIGFVDALSPKPNPSFLDFKHKGSVYNLCYGPSLENKDDIVLYSLGDGAVFMHHKGSKSLNIEDLFSYKRHRSNIAFHPSGQFLALGSDDGSVEICRVSDLKIVGTLKSYQKLIQSLAWHPVMESSSAMKNYLAVASNEFDIHVWNMDSILNSDEDCIVTKPDIVLSGHKLRIITLAWSPYDEDKLLSVSYDGTAQVWAVSEAKPLSNFRGHINRVFSCIWSPFGAKDLVLTGAEDNMLICWDYTKQKFTQPIKKGAAKKEKLSQAVFVRESPEKSVESSNDSNGLEVTPPKREDKDVSPASHKEKNFPKKLNKKHFFPVTTSSEATYKDTVHIDLESLYQDNLDLEARPHMAVFSPNAEDFEKLVQVESDALAEKAMKGDEMLSLAHWSGDSNRLKSIIENAAGHLTDFHVNLASSLGPEVWKWACLTFAKQLEEKGNATKASSYYLMAHEVDKAIQVLINANFHLAAMTLAKSRLPKDHAMIKDLFKLWALQATQDGMLELASKCWMAGGFVRESALALAKRPDGHSLRVAAEMLVKCGEVEQATVLAFQALDSFYKEGDSEGIKMLSEKIPSEKIRQRVQELLCEKTG